MEPQDLLKFRQRALGKPNERRGVWYSSQVDSIVADVIMQSGQWRLVPGSSEPIRRLISLYGTIPTILFGQGYGHNHSKDTPGLTPAAMRNLLSIGGKIRTSFKSWNRLTNVHTSQKEEQGL